MATKLIISHNYSTYKKVVSDQGLRFKSIGFAATV